MNPELSFAFSSIQTQLDKINLNEFQMAGENILQFSSKAQQIIEDNCKNLSAQLKKRIQNEFTSWGPLNDLIDDESITEIIVNGPHAIWYEKNGQLFQLADNFWSDVTFRNIVEKVCNQSHIHLTVENPCADSKWLDFRISLVDNEITQNNIHFNLRRHPKKAWNFERLQQNNWASEKEFQVIREIINNKSNFLMIGATGSGKTSVLNACLGEIKNDERVLIIEDTEEIHLPNSAGVRLLTRESNQNILPSIDQTQLVKRALRLRPDRIIMGEIRGAEAKDFLMSLATGHRGSFGTLHAQNPHQALIRLEMLIQMEAPQWNLIAVRRLIQLSLEYIIVTKKNNTGQRVLDGIYKISSLEEQGFLLEKC